MNNSNVVTIINQMTILNSNDARNKLVSTITKEIKQGLRLYSTERTKESNLIFFKKMLIINNIHLYWPTAHPKMGNDMEAVKISRRNDKFLFMEFKKDVCFVENKSILLLFTKLIVHAVRVISKNLKLGGYKQC